MSGKQTTKFVIGKQHNQRGQPGFKKWHVLLANAMIHSHTASAELSSLHPRSYVRALCERPPRQFLARFVAGHVLPAKWRQEMELAEGEGPPCIIHIKP
jgi:hypothetical protein